MSKSRTVASTWNRAAGPPRVESIRIQNYRVLKDIEFHDLQPLTVLLGPNGSGKSTVFDAFNFLSECFLFSLRHAWDRRGKAREIRSRGQSGPIVFELKYREAPGRPIVTYHLAIDESSRGPFVKEEWLSWRRGQSGRPFRFLDYRDGVVKAISGEEPEGTERRVEIKLRSPELIAVNTLGQLAVHPRVAALREFITDWYVSYLSVNDVRGQPEAGPQERLNTSGDNLPNVIEYLKDQHPEKLAAIFERLRQRIPRLESVTADIMADGRLLLRIKDKPFDQPILSRFASDGTLKLLAYLVILFGPRPPQFIGIEEPENFLHPRLLNPLAEECRAASELSQLLITSHSPFFINGMRPDEVRILYRDEEGFTQSQLASEIPGIPEFLKEGALLGQLWLENQFGMGDPLVNAGAPRNGRKPPI